ncbi:MAG TPA: T9SS type A sorting domain-containing protein [Chitinophagales bacterium]|nr:T9SS type A sorting domain-containing protein [Chitinophagales bacterium]
MKKALLVILVFGVAFGAIACEVNPLAYHPATSLNMFEFWEPNSGQWSFFEKVQYYKDASCHHSRCVSIVQNDTGLVGPMYNSSEGKLNEVVFMDGLTKDTVYRQLITYNADGQVSYSVYQSYNKTAATTSEMWMEDNRMFYTYQDGLLVSYIHQQLDTTFKTLREIHYYYNNEGRLIEQRNSGAVNYKTYLFYNNDGNKVRESVFSLSPGALSWQNISNSSFTYHSGNLIIHEIDSTRNEQTDQWYANGKKIITNNIDGLPIEIISQVWRSDSVWENWTRETYEYCASIVNPVQDIIKEPVRFTLQPNPTTDVVGISIDENMVGGTLTINDLTGKQISSLQLQVSNTQIPINLPNGIYMVTVSNTTHTHTRKLVVAN